MKKLQDFNSKGDDKNWTNAKLVNSLIAQKARTVSDGSEVYHFKQKRRAEELENCGSHLQYLIDRKGNKRLHNAKFCHDKLCQICNIRKYNHESARLYHVVKYLKNLHKFMIGTFTIKNVKYDRISNAIEELNYAWRKMQGYKAIKPYLKGTVKKVECKVGNDNKCNVHIHVLMAVSPSFFHGKNSLNHAQWSKLWTRAVNKGYTPELHVERKGSYEQLKKTCNYISKSYVFGDWQLNDISRLIDIDNGTYRKHLIVYTGLLKETDNLINSSFKRKNKVSTGKYQTYGMNDNFDYDSATIETYMYKKTNGKTDYYLKE
ncbi:hypothetical protein DY123_07590 [Apilactobacillus micheneri]|uniref:protein rep n=1 Tax=Apilactobacillus micheneri TaxID=1899430 RepID=UPI0011286533|nr:protein rep [Apilactobacillus micheneri]TPR41198.1 hypothetical protein DY123_07590 [Apilactobacillus micheneri]